jgi:hypothetical protein
MRSNFLPISGMTSVFWGGGVNFNLHNVIWFMLANFLRLIHTEYETIFKVILLPLYSQLRYVYL